MDNGNIIALEAGSALNDLLAQESKPVIIDFWAPWCGPCVAISPKLHSLANHFGDQISIIKIMVEDHPDLVAYYEVKSIPTLLLLGADKKVKKRLIGDLPLQDMTKEVDALLLAH